MAKDLHTFLKKKVLVLDGACGTELQKRGLPQGACPEIWCLEHPQVLVSIHTDYQEAGSDIIYTCTFGANRIKLAQYSTVNVRKTNKDLALLARRAVGDKALIAGDIGPTGKFVEPFGPLAFEETVNIFKEQVRGLLDGGVDLFVIETMMDIQEARAALLAVKELTGQFTLVTMTFEKDGRTLSGTDPKTALITLQSLGADAVGCNCSTGPDDMLRFIKMMKPYSKVPLVAKPNAGMPRLRDGKTFFDMSPEEFSFYGKKFVAAGINMIGGCCGTSPDHIKELKDKIDRAKPLSPSRDSISALSSARKSLVLEGKRPLAIIGECINPTGKKALREELEKGQLSLVRQLAKDQERSGADLLDINAGIPGINEAEALCSMARLLAVSTDLPLCIDSSNSDAIEKVLRLYPGRALMNSISGEKTKLKKLLSIAAKYGTMFILLPLDTQGIPKDFRKRKAIIQTVLDEAKKFGFSKEDIIVDGMVMTVSTHAQNIPQTLKTIEWCSKTFRTNTVIGLSNVSFGMPERSAINARFLDLAYSQGLALVIANPLDSKVLNIKRRLDKYGRRQKELSDFLTFIQNLSKTRPVDKNDISNVIKKSSPIEKVETAILEGNKEEIIDFVKKVLKSGMSAKKLMDKTLIPTINKVGDLYDRKEYFLPQLIASAEAMKLAFSYLEPHFKKDHLGQAKKTVVILATVKDDVHDIGKNIVALLLKNHGFSVVDLGKDVSSARIISEIKRHSSPIVGLSALMTTTMVNMKDVIEKAQKQNLKCRFIVGGAAVTKSYAHALKAEYAHDGIEAVHLVKKLSH